MEKTVVAARLVADVSTDNKHVDFVPSVMVLMFLHEGGPGEIRVETAEVVPDVDLVESVLPDTVAVGLAEGLESNCLAVGQHFEVVGVE